MSIRLAPQTEALIREQLDTGRYSTADAVIEVAVRLLAEHDRRLAQLRAKLKVGLDELDRGDGDEGTPELVDRLSREGDDLYRRGEQPDPDACP